MKELTGNLLDLADAGVFDVIVHGCNCQCVMGAGIAKQIAERYPQARHADNATRPTTAKLGTVSIAVASRYHLWKSRPMIIVNGYTQAVYGRGAQVNYAAIRDVFRYVKQTFSGYRIGYPSIGAGLVGGDWASIREIIDHELDGEDHTWVKFEPSTLLRKG